MNTFFYFYEQIIEIANFKTNNYLEINALNLALNKTLNKIKEGKLSPAIFPLIISKDLNLDKDLANELSVICAFFHTSADLIDDIEDNSNKNEVINKVGKEQAINISNKLLFISQQLICELNIEDKNKITLLNLFSKSGNTMCSGQFHDIKLTNSNCKDKNLITNISENKSGIELACFLSCLSTSLGRKDDKDFYNLGLYYGSLIQVFSDYFDIWGEEISDDLVELKNSLPIFSGYNDPIFKEEVRLLLSGKNDLISKQFQLKRLLSRTKAVENFEEYYKLCQKEINNSLNKIVGLKELKDLINDLLSSCEEMISSLKEIREVVESSDDKIIKSDFTQSIKMSSDYLESYDLFKDSWEIQRWGFLGEEILTGNLFTPSIIIETFLDNYNQQKENIVKILNMKNQSGWHYYTNTNKIPTDADDLGQILQLASRINYQDKSIFDISLNILENNIENSGMCPTWLSDGKLFTKEEISETWYGNECLGVMANLYYGLYLFDKDKYQEKVIKGINYILENYDEEINGWKSSYYNEAYTFYLISRLINKLQIKSDKLDKVKEKYINSQKLNGSWNNSPQDTASILLGLIAFENLDEIIIKTALNYLNDTQNFDGSWYGEDLFVCPGKDNRFVYFKNAKVTSAICLRALIKGVRMLETIEDSETNSLINSTN